MDVEIYRQKYVAHPSKFGIPVPDQVTADPVLGFQTFSWTPRLPRRGSVEAAGYDVCAFLPEHGSMTIAPLQTVMVPTGLFMSEEALSVVLVCSRSGLASEGVMVANGPGIIDSDYRGEIKILLTYIAPYTCPPFVIHHNDRIAQFLFLSPGKVNMDVTFTDVGQCELRGSTRGGDGFGSTGR